MPKKPTYYTSIDDMPIYNWFKINETNDLSYMLVNRGQMGNKAEAKKTWEMVYGEYIDTFGVNENYQTLLEKQRELLLLRAEKAVEGEKFDMFKMNFMDMLEIDIRQLSTGQEKSKTNEAKVHLEKHLGFRINEKETSVKEYYTYLEVMRKDIMARQSKAA